jgi:HlyD family secretion protein
MTANVKILIDEHQNALKIPDAALRYRPAGVAAKTKPGTTEVWILDAKGRPAPVPVSLGLTDGVSTEVIGGGLKEGDRVIVASLTAKSSGAPAAPMGRRGPGF